MLGEKLVKLREPFVRKHVHTWKLSFINSDYGMSSEMERECIECDETQHARITREERDSLPESVLHLGCFDWRHGPL